MSNFSVTISNVVNVFGGAGTDLWAAYNWNAFKWGDGTLDLETRTTRVIDCGSLTPTASIIKLSLRIIANSLLPGSQMASETLKDQAGYSYVFPSDTTDAELRTIPAYTSGTLASSTWASQSVGSTTWS